MTCSGTQLSAVAHGSTTTFTEYHTVINIEVLYFYFAGCIPIRLSELSPAVETLIAASTGTIGYEDPPPRRRRVRRRDLRDDLRVFFAI